jgi:hypothetical protein
MDEFQARGAMMPVWFLCGTEICQGILDPQFFGLQSLQDQIVRPWSRALLADSRFEVRVSRFKTFNTSVQ